MECLSEDEVLGFVRGEMSPEDRERARALAAESRAALAAAGDRGRRPLADVDAWLDER